VGAGERFGIFQRNVQGSGRTVNGVDRKRAGCIAGHHRAGLATHPDLHLHDLRTPGHPRGDAQVRQAFAGFRRTHADHLLTLLTGNQIDGHDLAPRCHASAPAMSADQGNGSCDPPRAQADVVKGPSLHHRAQPTDLRPIAGCSTYSSAEVGSSDRGRLNIAAGRRGARRAGRAAEQYACTCW
jgi:hypothetical protein